MHWGREGGEEDVGLVDGRGKEIGWRMSPHTTTGKDQSNRPTGQSCGFLDNEGGKKGKSKLLMQLQPYGAENPKPQTAPNKRKKLLGEGRTKKTEAPFHQKWA